MRARGEWLDFPCNSMMPCLCERGAATASPEYLAAMEPQRAAWEAERAAWEARIRTWTLLTFAVIICTVVLQSATARPLARLMKVAEPSPSGFLIVTSTTPSSVRRRVKTLLLVGNAIGRTTAHPGAFADCWKNHDNSVQCTCSVAGQWLQSSRENKNRVLNL